VTDATHGLELVPEAPGSALASTKLRLAPGDSHRLGDVDGDQLFFVADGLGRLAMDGETHEIGPGAAVLLLANEEASLATDDGLAAVCVSVGPDAERHAPLGARQSIARLDQAGSENATGARSFQILFGPHNGSTRATLFAGFIPPGKAPWHYHLYDEIVWVPAGPGRLHIGETTQELGPGSAFRLRPRQVHIVENLSATETMTIIGVFTPAGSPSAAYLTPEIAAEYRFAE